MFQRVPLATSLMSNAICDDVDSTQRYSSKTEMSGEYLFVHAMKSEAQSLQAFFEHSKH